MGKLLRPFSPWRPVVESPPAIRSCEEQELGRRFGIQGNRRRIFLESRRRSRVQPACSRSCRRAGQRERADEVCDPPHRWPVCPADTCHGFIWLSWASGWLATLTRDSCHRSCLQLRSRYSPGALATVPAALLAQPWGRRAWLRDAPRARSPGGFSGPSHSVPPSTGTVLSTGTKQELIPGSLDWSTGARRCASKPQSKPRCARDAAGTRRGGRLGTAAVSAELGPSARCLGLRVWHGAQSPGRLAGAFQSQPMLGPPSSSWCPWGQKWACRWKEASSLKREPSRRCWALSHL